MQREKPERYGLGSEMGIWQDARGSVEKIRREDCVLKADDESPWNG
jgi:hypothetical protein